MTEKKDTLTALYFREWRKNSPEAYAKQKAVKVGKRRELSPEARKRHNERTRLYQNARYRVDEEYREKRKASALAYYYKKKLELAEK